GRAGFGQPGSSGSSPGYRGPGQEAFDATLHSRAGSNRTPEAGDGETGNAAGITTVHDKTGYYQNHSTLMEYPAGSRIMVSSARQVRSATYPWWVYIVVPLFALLIQVYLPLFQTLRFISRIELPLLVTIYFALMRRSQLRGLAIGVALGLAQDSVFQQHIGMYGICKTLVGYFSASIGMQFDVEHGLVRLILCFVFYLFHQFFFWVLQRALLDQPAVLEIQTELVLAAINAIIGVALFHFLDKLRRRE